MPAADHVAGSLGRVIGRREQGQHLAGVRVRSSLARSLRAFEQPRHAQLDLAHHVARVSRHRVHAAERILDRGARLAVIDDASKEPPECLAGLVRVGERSRLRGEPFQVGADDRLEELLLRREMAVQRADPHAGPACDLLDADSESVGGEHLVCRGEQARAIALRVDALLLVDLDGRWLCLGHSLALTARTVVAVEPTRIQRPGFTHEDRPARGRKRRTCAHGY
jgi:hypothetical protein